jgi:hypothetical protein
LDDVLLGAKIRKRNSESERARKIERKKEEHGNLEEKLKVYAKKGGKIRAKRMREE